jgi:hypothetical protein
MPGYSYTKEPDGWRVFSGDKPLVVIHGGNITVMPKEWQYCTGFTKRLEGVAIPSSLQDSQKYDYLDLNKEPEEAPLD